MLGKKSFSFGFLGFLSLHLHSKRVLVGLTTPRLLGALKMNFQSGAGTGWTHLAVVCRWGRGTPESLTLLPPMQSKSDRPHYIASDTSPRLRFLNCKIGPNESCLSLRYSRIEMWWPSMTCGTCNTNSYCCGYQPAAASVRPRQHPPQCLFDDSIINDPLYYRRPGTLVIT